MGRASPTRNAFSSGGTTRSTYFVSALGSKEVGSIQPNDQFKANLRANVTFVPTDKWTVEVRSSYTRNIINELQAGNNWTALLGNASAAIREATLDAVIARAGDLEAALTQLGVVPSIINALVTGFIAMIALAGGLAFGLGGRDYAAHLLSKLRESTEDR